MSFRALATTAAIAATLILSGTIANAADPGTHCESRIQTVNAMLNGGNPNLGRTARSLVERNAAMGAYLHEQGKHAQAHGYLDFALGKASAPAG
ncbi:hypothetical protein HUE56_30500 (plasmid) [Azospirillum oryzae]|uniref:Uncharacterized protein n=1 Tax=Azospirillum oryzae TaxID=286727 RepID=A0A6N1ASM6_9PROT|nr:hypothetical protein [Azospirillum oryzae]KAA0585401.1 hypothetical protein FZ938_25810 [Azospirillum oryzae]QKS54825.1 hypothetical protein HUE56_30500 [Azospirillum oryzae]GLR77417.1 hypothetical protein GCM10007856_00850 [Azospirillum oryzae]